MTDLIDEVKDSFEKTHEETNDKGPVSIIRTDGEELAPGFMAMRSHYEERLLAAARRGYRHHAGCTLPTAGDELLQLTQQPMLALLIALSTRAFADGVLIGQENNPIVRMALHFHQADHCYHEPAFIDASTQMALGFSRDEEVSDYFIDYVKRGVSHIAHVCGFAHDTEVNPAKVWDIWLLTGTSCVCASFLAGNKLGTTWKERDVLDGIEIATEGQLSGTDEESPSDH